jgi:hypothetical protein
LGKNIRGTRILLCTKIPPPPEHERKKEISYFEIETDFWNEGNRVQYNNIEIIIK